MPIRKMYYRYHGDSGVQWETVCICEFDCFDLSVLGLSMGTNMKADLCIQTLENALTAYPRWKERSSIVTVEHSIPVSPTARPSGSTISTKA